PDITDTPTPISVGEAGQPDRNLAVDTSGNAIIEMLRKAADMANEDCMSAMDTAHRLSRELLAAEDRARAAEVEVERFRDRAIKAEAWLIRIQNQIEESFFQEKKLKKRLEELSPPDP